MNGVTEDMSIMRALMSSILVKVTQRLPELLQALTLIRHCVVFFNLAPLVAVVALKGVPPQKFQALQQLLVVVSH